MRRFSWPKSKTPAKENGCSYFKTPLYICCSPRSFQQQFELALTQGPLSCCYQYQVVSVGTKKIHIFSES
jgi:hypothetical protein